MGRFVFKLPDVGEGTAEAELVGWHVKVGDTVAEDQIIADVMTDKATVELTSPVAGKVIAAHGEPGQQLAVGSPLIEFEVEGAGNASAEAAPTPKPEPIAPAAPALEAPNTSSEPEPAAAPAASGANYVFKLPDVGEGTAEAELVGWHVKVGDTVSEDQIIADVMTDKATVELTSPVAGTVVALHGDAGQQIAVGGPLVSFQVEGKGNQAAAPAPVAAATAPKAEAVPAPVAKGPAPAPAKTVAKPQAEAFTTRAAGQRPLASPAVRNRARDLGVELQFVPGSGPAGRIEHSDLDAYVASGGRGSSVSGSSTGSTYAQAEGTTEVRIIGLRRKIAEKMAESVRRIPHITYVEEIDVTALEELRAHLNAANKGSDKPKLNVLPFIARAIVVALRDQPQINAHYDEAGVLTQHAPVHLGIAAQTPNGLMVPVVRHAEARDPYDTALEIARVSAAAKSGKASREELSGSTITITSLGTLGGVVHTPIINHPEVAIVGPNKIIERVVVKDGQMVVRKMMNLSSSFDHRIVDGHDAAVFVQRIKGLLEHPATLWMG
ncbi:2-oxoisovalerate dehydrogenase E2 component (dihydrolipoyl transacylase) [Brevundimonas alba]|uniref:Dihydrolipoamide acetyltransferase component of pyruvate dehydrogenase complex n=1 Tax=Brevundimonas alba TaxID=74314 RepID=A0A7X6BNF4_9CAUL|nr:2-oxo acid dehydrogenase subunit E2 [Brevundimonas alba]NJC40401.1 2-oxoisovalerate dehydrogenase E2 component (dihydrolipoyl transacylase) [Brevundimonas alba]